MVVARFGSPVDAVLMILVATGFVAIGMWWWIEMIPWKQSKPRVKPLTPEQAIRHPRREPLITRIMDALSDLALAFMLLSGFVLLPAGLLLLLWTLFIF